MSAAAAVFLLMLVAHGGDGLSLTKVREFQSQVACQAAVSAIEAAIGKDQETVFACIPASGIRALQR